MRAGVAVLGLALLGAIASLSMLPRLRFDHDTRSLLREDAAADEVEAALSRDFGAEDILLLAWEIEAFDAAAFRRVRAVAADLAAIPGLEKTYSIGGRPVTVRVGKVLRPLNETDFETGEKRAAARAALLEAEPYLGTLYSPDLDVVAVASSFRPAPLGERMATLAAVRAVARRHGTNAGPIHVAGVTALTADAGAYALADLRRIGLLALAAAVVVLLALCRSLRETLAAVIATCLPPLLALGVAAAFELPLTALGAALFPVLAVVGITSSVHLLHAYGERVAAGTRPRAAAFAAAASLAAPILLSLGTTAVAFGSLEATGVPAFRAGGLVVALGMVIAMPVVLLALPTLLVVLRPGPRRAPRASRAGGAVTRAILTRPGAIAATGLAATLAGAWCASRADLRVEVLQAFQPESEIARTYAFLEDRLTPTVPIDLVLDAYDGRSAAEVAAELESFGAHAVEQPGVERALSLATLLRYGKKVSPLPLNDALALGVLRSPLYADTTRRFWDWERNRYRLKLRVREGTPPAVLDTLGAQAANLKTGKGRLTGLYVRAVGTSRALVGDLVRGAAWMTLLAVVLIALVFRSWRLGVAALLPNVLPVAVVLGGAALVGAPFDVSVVAVGAVAVGLA
ncbi:MAG: MMPL family transporter, partial [Planctomycetota bacterium]|nr:MMPL family transporter [Planctomycetota bacterium]